MDHEDIMRGFCAVLDSCETRPRADLYAQHMIMLERLCRHARDTTDFYAERLKPLFGAADGFRLEAWNDILPLSRSDLLQEFEALKSKKVPANFGGLVLKKSSGSTGQPVQALWTDTQNLATQCVIRRLHHWHAIDPGELLVRFAPTPLSAGLVEAEEPFWGPVYKALKQPGCLVNVNTHLPTKHIVEQLETLRPQHIVARPREMLAVANSYLDRDTRPSFSLKSLRAYGELRTSSIDDRLLDMFGVRPISNYTTEEVGHIAMQCPDCQNYHVVDEMIHVDVVDDLQQPIDVGSVGRILTTPLYSYAMPLIRYELGDDVRLAQRMCRRSQSVDLSEVIGREGDLFHHPEGGRFRPTNQMLTRVGYMLGAGAVQMAQQGVTSFVIRYQAVSAPTKSALRATVGEIREAFGFEFTVSLERVFDIPSKASGKRQDFVCELDTPPGDRNDNISQP